MTPGKFKLVHKLPKKTHPEHMKLFKVKAQRVWDIFDSNKLITIGNLRSLTSSDIAIRNLRLDNYISVDKRMSELYKFIALSFCCRLVWVEVLTKKGEALKTLEIWGPRNLVSYADIAIGYYHMLTYKIRVQMRTKLRNRNEYLRQKARLGHKVPNTIDPRKQANDFYKLIISLCDEEVKDIYQSHSIGILSNHICRESLNLVDRKLIEEGNLNFKKFVKRHEVKRIYHALAPKYVFSKRRVLSLSESEFNIFD